MIDTVQENDIKRILTSWRNWFSGIVVTGAIVAGLLYFADDIFLYDGLSSVSWKFLVVAYLFLWCNQFVSSFRLLIASRVPLSKKTYMYSMNVNVLQQVAVRFLPMRTSEILWIYLVKKRFQFNIRNSISLLVHIRVWDMCILFALVTVVIPLTLAEGISSHYQSTLLVVVVLGLFFLMLLPTRVFFRFTRKVSRWMKFHRWPRLCRLHGLGILRSLRVAARHRPIAQIALALISWISSFASMIFILQALGVSLPLHQALIALTMLLVSSALPLPALGIVGGGELGFAASLGSMGFSLTEASSAALLLGLFHSFLSFLVGLVWLLARGGGFVLLRKNRD